MTVSALLEFLPRYSDNSGYVVVINYKTKYTKSYNGLGWNGIVLPDNKEDIDKCLIYPFESIEQIYKSKIERIDAGKVVPGGHVDDRLQIYLKTEKFIPPNQIKPVKKTPKI